jgi:hypothetical protein
MVTSGGTDFLIEATVHTGRPVLHKGQDSRNEM